MRTPDFINDGWCLEDGEKLHQEFPKTFQIPDIEVRRILQIGDYAKLIFRIAVDDGDPSGSVERMWVIIRERLSDGYVGILNNKPTAIEENDSLWLGSELPFEYRHIISVEHANEESLKIVQQPPPIPWER